MEEHTAPLRQGEGYGTQTADSAVTQRDVTRAFGECRAIGDTVTGNCWDLIWSDSAAHIIRSLWGLVKVAGAGALVGCSVNPTQAIMLQASFEQAAVGSAVGEPLWATQDFSLW